MSFYREYTTCLVGKSKRTSENSREEQIKQKTYSRQILAPGKLKSNRCWKAAKIPVVFVDLTFEVRRFSGRKHGFRPQPLHKRRGQDFPRQGRSGTHTTPAMHLSLEESYIRGFTLYYTLDAELAPRKHVTLRDFPCLTLHLVQTYTSHVATRLWSEANRWRYCSHHGTSCERGRMNRP